MHYLVLDLEWNIPDYELRQKLLKQYSLEVEIIEIGAVLLDKDLQIVGRFFSEIKAQFIKKLNVHVGEVTKREGASLRQGKTFPEAISEFNRWLDENNVQQYLLCTWSNCDAKPWLSNLGHYKLLPERIPKLLDVQRLFAHEIEEFSAQKSLAFAMEHYAIPQEVDLHVALHDAAYTALVLQCILHNLQEKQRLPKNTNALYHDLQRLSFDPTLPTSLKIDMPHFATLADLENAVYAYQWPCPACMELMNEYRSAKAWKHKKPYRMFKTFRCREHGNVQVQVSFYRDTLSEGITPFTAKAKISIQRPL